MKTNSIPCVFWKNMALRMKMIVPSLKQTASSPLKNCSLERIEVMLISPFITGIGASTFVSKTLLLWGSLGGGLKNGGWEGTVQRMRREVGEGPGPRSWKCSPKVLPLENAASLVSLKRMVSE